MTIGKRITELRKQKKLSQEALAEELNISRQSVSKWENDQAVPDMENLLALAELLDADLMYLAYGMDPKEKSTAQISQNTAKDKNRKIVMILLSAALAVSVLLGARYYHLYSKEENRVASMEQLCGYQAIYALDLFKQYQISGKESTYWYAVSEYRAFMQSFDQMTNDTYLNIDYIDMNIVYSFMVNKPEKVDQCLDDVIAFLEIYAEDPYDVNGGYYVRRCRNALQGN